MLQIYHKRSVLYSFSKAVFIILTSTHIYFTNMDVIKECVIHFRSFHLQSDSLAEVLRKGTALCIVCLDEKENDLK